MRGTPSPNQTDKLPLLPLEIKATLTGAMSPVIRQFHNLMASSRIHLARSFRIPSGDDTGDPANA